MWKDNIKVYDEWGCFSDVEIQATADGVLSEYCDVLFGQGNNEYVELYIRNNIDMDAFYNSFTQERDMLIVTAYSLWGRKAFAGGKLLHARKDGTFEQAHPKSFAIVYKFLSDHGVL